jgi:hypothetical protein
MMEMEMRKKKKFKKLSDFSDDSEKICDNILNSLLNDIDDNSINLYIT